MWLPKKGRHTGLPLRVTELFFDKQKANSYL
jgi:hypothetical protein